VVGLMAVSGLITGMGLMGSVLVEVVSLLLVIRKELAREY
jgi:hypothetical protein